MPFWVPAMAALSLFDEPRQRAKDGRTSRSRTGQEQQAPHLLSAGFQTLLCRLRGDSFIIERALSGRRQIA